MKTSLRDLAGRSAAPAPRDAEPGPTAATNTIKDEGGRTYRTAQTRTETRQVAGHFKPDVAQTLKLIAVEEDRDIQEILAEALNMVFARYGKAVRADIASGRRRNANSPKMPKGG